MSPLKYCPKCGSEIEDPDQKFCKTCGADLKARESQESPSPMRIERKVEPAVKLQPEYGGFWERFAAFIIDFIILRIISEIILSLINLPLLLVDPVGYLLDARQIFNRNLFDWGIGFLYFWILEAYNQGQTLGKMALHLRTVDEDTLEVAKPVNYAVNNLAKPSLFLILDLIIGFLVSEGDLKNRFRVLQDLSHTVVIKEQNY
ncbi:MAG: zinc-ribbon domain-containing protein [Candidatus Lokiarchaeota archaeon]|nr:zinc-ribbon domain-containing protein [Candidatus Lokiarchaeota archaeon]